MRYVDEETGVEVEVLSRAQERNISIPALIDEGVMGLLGIAELRPTLRPTPLYKPGANILVDGKWTTTWIAPTSEEIEADLDAKFNAYLDSVARQRRYNDRFTCAIRAGYPSAFQAEGVAFATWMDQCNVIAYQIMAEVKSGARPVPTFEEFIAELPEMVWPESIIPEGAA